MKCFDRIEIDAVSNAMRYMGFSTMLCQWLQICYTNFKLKVQNNGKFSKEINPTRGVHQGGPTSNAYFLVIAELLALEIRGDATVKGAFIKEVLQLLNQYADDMDVSAKYDEHSVKKILQHIETFGRSTGFKLNYDKTTVYRVGSMRQSNAKMYTGELNCTNEGLNILGVEVTHDYKRLMETNYQPIIDKTRTILNSWINRRLSIIGKVQVINTLVASLFVYKMTVLPKINPAVVQTMYSMFDNFIWSGHRPKIKLDVIQLPKSDGGLGLVDLERKDDALKATWVKLIMEGVYPHQIVHSTLQPVLGERIWMCNLHVNDVATAIKATNLFWVDVLKAWCKYHYVERQCTPVLWLNSDIRVNDIPVLWEQPLKNGLLFVSDLCNESGFTPQSEVAEKYGLSVMEYNMLKSAIPKCILKACKETTGQTYVDKKFADLMHSDNPTKLVYQAMSGRDTKMVTKKEEMWCEELGIEVNIPDEVQRTFRICKVAKFNSFQYRILLRACVTNIQLYKWGISDTDMCTFCNSSKETVNHLLYECKYVEPLWHTLRVTCKVMLNQVVDLSYANVMFKLNLSV